MKFHHGKQYQFQTLKQNLHSSISPHSTNFKSNPYDAKETIQKDYPLRTVFMPNELLTDKISSLLHNPEIMHKNETALNRQVCGLTRPRHKTAQCTSTAQQAAK